MYTVRYVFKRENISIVFDESFPSQLWPHGSSSNAASRRAVWKIKWNFFDSSQVRAAYIGSSPSQHFRV